MRTLADGTEVYMYVSAIKVVETQKLLSWRTLSEEDALALISQHSAALRMLTKHENVTERMVKLHKMVWRL